MSYADIYFKRLNHYGHNMQSRIQNQREKVFLKKLETSIYRIDFEYNGQVYPATFERYKQDETETLHYLLTQIDLKIPNGTILELPASNKSDDLDHWMVYRLEKIQASGYNKYIMLKMSHLIIWKDRSGTQHQTWAYFYGQEDNMLQEEAQYHTAYSAFYTEKIKLSTFICPINEYIEKDDYFTVGEGKLKQAFVVTGYDRISTEGVEYVSVDPRFIRDETAAPTKSSGDRDEDYYWLGGVKNG